MCCVLSMALPCNEEVPVAVSVLGVTLFPKQGCCMSIEDLKGGAPDSYEMESRE